MIKGLSNDLDNISAQLNNISSHMLSNDDYLSSMHISSINALSDSLTTKINKNSNNIDVISNWIDDKFEYFPNNGNISPKQNIFIRTNISSIGKISSTDVTAVNAIIDVLSAKNISVDNIVPKNLSTDICVLVNSALGETYIITSLYQTDGIIKIESELLNEGRVDGLVSDLENISSSINELSGDLYDCISETSSVLSSDLTNTISSVSSDLTNTISSVSSDLIDTISSVSGDLYDCISETSSVLSSDLIDTISSVSNDLYECITEVSGNLSGNFTVSSNILCGAINTISSTISNFLSNEITSINSEIDSLSGHVSTKIFVGNYISNDISGDYSDLSVLKTTMDEYQ
jgi:hypothetical protein